METMDRPRARSREEVDVGSGMVIRTMPFASARLPVTTAVRLASPWWWMNALTMYVPGCRPRNRKEPCELEVAEAVKGESVP